MLLFAMDAADALTHIEDGAIKLAYGSPPYPNALRNYGRWTGPEWLEMMQRHTFALTPKLRADGFLVINVKACREEAPRGGNSYRRRWVERFLIWVEENLSLWAFDDEVWTKDNPVTTGLRSAAQDGWEGIYIWARSNPWTWNIDAVRRAYSQASLDRYRTVYKPAGNGLTYTRRVRERTANPRGALPVNILSGAVVGGKGNHQARQPEYLPERYIKAFTDRDDLVVDPWMGSGTTLAVAQRLGRRFGGFDIDAANVEMVRRRLYPQFGT